MTTSNPGIDVRTRSGEPLRITLEESVAGAAADELWRLYLRAFEPLRTRAAARQVLHADEFSADLTDPRVLKYVAWSSDGQPVALAALSRHLETVPWISPEYFRFKYPEHAAREAIYYFSFVIVHPRLQQETVMEQLVLAGIGPLIEQRAVCGMDVCAFNNLSFDFAARIEAILHRLADGEMTELDAQYYYAISFR